MELLTAYFAKHENRVAEKEVWMKQILNMFEGLETIKEEWTKIAGTFVAPSATPFLSIGFMNGEAVGSSMEFNLAYKPEEAIYFAEEVAYDIEVNSENATVSLTTPITVEAKFPYG